MSDEVSIPVPAGDPVTYYDLIDQEAVPVKTLRSKHKIAMEDLSWKNLKLALERPYKDDNGDEIPVLFDISPDGQHIYEPYVDLNSIYIF